VCVRTWTRTDEFLVPIEVLGMQEGVWPGRLTDLMTGSKMTAECSRAMRRRSAYTDWHVVCRRQRAPE
jgi:hypothetical protein